MSKSIPGLNDLANRLKDISFPDEFNLCGIAVEERAANGDIHHCHPRPGHGVEVRFFLGGAQRILGFTDNATDAARFSDMALVWFQKYRKRGSNVTLVDQDLNLDLHQVAVDSEEVPQAVALLSDIEHLLLAEGVIVAPGTLPPHGPDVRVRTRSTQKGELLATLKEINTTQNHIYELLARVELRLNALQPHEMSGSMPHPIMSTNNMRLSGCEGD